MAGEFKGLTIKFRGDASDLSKALATINNDMRVTTRSGMEVNRILAMKGASGNINLLAQNVKIAGDRCKEWQERIETLKAGQQAMLSENHEAEEQIARLGERTEENAEAYDELTKTIEENNAAYAHAQDEIERAEARLDAYTQQLREAEAAYDRNATKLGQFGQKMKDVGSGMQTVGGAMQSAGATLTRTVTGPLVAFGTVSVRSAVQVDTALTGVRKTLDATEAQYQALKDAAIESSKVQPVDAATILDIEALGAQLGFSIDELEEFARVASGLDVATDMNWEDAATNMAQFSNIMHMGHEDVGRYGSTIVALGNNFATTESSVSDMAMRIAAAGKSLGMSEADVLGLAGALTSMGVSAEAGGSSISTIMSNIDKDVAVGGEALQTWAETAGMSAEEFASAWKDEPVDALARVLSGLDAATQEGSSMAIMLENLGIGSIRQTDVMKRLAGNTELMTSAVKMANDAWKENTALQAEVDNRNESMASKLQVLANKLQAIAIEVGEPLANALIDAVDAAEPLIQKVGDLAQAFADMDEDEQRNIIKWGLMAAAAGPLLTVFGKLTSGAGTLVSKLGDGAQTISVFAGQIKRGNGFMTALTTAFEGAETGILGLKVALGALAIGAAVALVAKLTEGWRENRRHAQALDSALSGMRANTEGLGRAMTIGSDGIKRLGSTASGTKGDIDGLLQMLQEHNQKNAETRASAESSIGMLQEYKDVVDRLAGAGSASAEDMALLEWALKGIEEQTGNTYEASDVLAGKYQDEAGETRNLRDEIDQLIDAKKREAEVSAVQSMYTEAIEARMRAQQELETVEAEYHDKHDKWVADVAAGYEKQGMSAERAAEVAEKAFRNGEYGHLAADVETARRAVEGLTEEEQTYADMLGDLTEAENAHWGAREKIIMTTDKMRDACERLGIDAAALSQGLQDAGVSAEDFARIGGDQFAIMAEMAGGDMATLIGLIQDYNATEFDSKYGELHVDGVGNVVDANGTIMEFNGTEFVPKFLEVDTNAGEAAGEVEDLKQKSDSVSDKNAKVDASVSGKNLVEDLDKAIRTVPKSTGVSMTANVYGKGNVDNLLNTLASANGRTYDVYFNTHNTTYNRTVNEGPRARGAIISHAAGDILMANKRGDGVMWDAYNRIGEQGAEAIVPLQRPFADDFAGTVADAMARQGLIGQQAIDYARLGQAVASALAGMGVTIDGDELIGAITTRAARASRMYGG